MCSMKKSWHIWYKIQKPFISGVTGYYTEKAMVHLASEFWYG